MSAGLTAGCSIRLTARRTTRTACPSSARRSRSRSMAKRSSAAVYDPNRRELFTAERGQGAWMNGVPLRVSRAAALIDSLLVTGFHYDVHKNRADLIELFAQFSAARAPCAGSDRRRSTSATSRPAASTGSGRSSCTPGTSPPARSSSQRLAAGDDDGWVGPSVARRQRPRHQRAHPRGDARQRSVSSEQDAAGGRTDISLGTCRCLRVPPIADIRPPPLGGIGGRIETGRL